MPLVQKIDGMELYCGVMLYPKGQDPAAILKDRATEISFATAASSGESSAKAATEGKASISVRNHEAAANAVKAGKAKAAFVKNFWWDNNKGKFPELEMYLVPGVSEKKNPDNILWASKSVAAELQAKLTKAAQDQKTAFGAKEMKAFDAAQLQFTLDLMAKGKIDPKTYSW